MYKIIVFICLLAGFGYACKNKSETPKSTLFSGSDNNERQADLKLELNSYTTLRNSPFILIPTRILNTDEKESSYRGSSYDDRIISWNILFYNTQTGTKHLLDESRKMAISCYTQGFKDTNTDSALATDKIFYRMRTADTNNDGALNSEDALYLFTSDLSGKGLKQISPPEYYLNEYMVTNSGSTVLMLVSRDYNKDGKYNNDDRQTIFSYTFGKDKSPTPLLNEADEAKITAAYQKMWR